MDGNLKHCPRGFGYLGRFCFFCVHYDWLLKTCKHPKIIERLTLFDERKSAAKIECCVVKGDSLEPIAFLS